MPDRHSMGASFGLRVVENAFEKSRVKVKFTAPVA
jgi:hypothetical protein